MLAGNPLVDRVSHDDSPATARGTSVARKCKDVVVEVRRHFQTT